jgi:YVTN family beta-propeller protein
VQDLTTDTQTDTMPLDKTPRALSMSPDGSTLLFTLAGSDAVQVLDVASRQVVSEVPVGASPHHPLFSADGTLAVAMVVSQGPGTLDLFRPDDPASDVPIAVGTMPHWIGLSPDGQLAYVTNEGSNDLSIVDLASRAVVATVPVGQAPRKIVVQPAMAPPADATGTISGFRFQPATILLAPGQAVNFTNVDSVAHTVTSVDGQWVSDEIAPGGTFRLVLDKPGSYAYVCSIHPFMQGTLTVQ